jgi:hypothetical protein
MIYLESSPKIKGCAPPSSTHRKTKKCIPDCEFSSFINFLFYLIFLLSFEERSENLQGGFSLARSFLRE